MIVSRFYKDHEWGVYATVLGAKKEKRRSTGQKSNAQGEEGLDHRPD